MNHETVQRLVLYAVLGLVLSAVDIQWDNPAFWCVTALLICSNWLERREGFEVGVAQGIEMISDMTEQQRNDVIALVKQAQKEDNE